MDKNTYALPGTSHVLKFNMGALKRMRSILGVDPIKALTDGTYEAVAFAEAIVLGACPEAKDAVEELGPSSISDIIVAFSKSFVKEGAEPAGEAGGDTQ